MSQFKFDVSCEFVKVCVDSVLRFVGLVSVPDVCGNASDAEISVSLLARVGLRGIDSNEVSARRSPLRVVGLVRVTVAYENPMFADSRRNVTGTKRGRFAAQRGSLLFLERGVANRFGGLNGMPKLLVNRVSCFFGLGTCFLLSVDAGRRKKHGLTLLSGIRFELCYQLRWSKRSTHRTAPRMTSKHSPNSR